jgi:hypothetical protein
MIRLATALLLLGTACATTASAPPQNTAVARVQRTLAGLTPQAPQRCIWRDRYTETRSADGVILFVVGKNRVWRNDVVGQGCKGLGRGDTLVFESLRGGEHCSGDLVRTRASTGGHLTGSCSLGSFTPYTR